MVDNAYYEDRTTGIFTVKLIYYDIEKDYPKDQNFLFRAQARQLNKLGRINNYDDI